MSQKIDGLSSGEDQKSYIVLVNENLSSYESITINITGSAKYLKRIQWLKIYF